MAPLRQTSKPYGHGDPPSPRTVLDTWSDHPTLFSHNSKTNMSSLRPPKTMAFPMPIPPPQNLPIRARAQNFAELDAVYNQTEHPILGSQGIRRGGYDKDTDESRNKDAVKILEQNILDREPFLQLASDRLQAACGVRNEAPFDLPETPKQGLGLGLFNMQPARSIAGKGRVDSGVGFIPRVPVGMHVVDKDTGKGLREFMLQKGKECGMRKFECKSITFHDLTPEMATALPNNILLGHYGVEKGERIDVYEVDLPATQTDEETSEEYLTTETWVWILMSRPLLSYDPNDQATIPVPDTTTSYARYVDSINDEPLLELTPPNFPKPIPASWLVFAAPKAHITTYPEVIENFDHEPSPYPFASKSKKIHKRIDYDFSFSGVPIFEFASADLFTQETKTEFLSIEQMGAWASNDAYDEYTTEEYHRVYSMWQAGEWGTRTGFMAEPTSVGLDEKGQPKASMPAPNRGLWWMIFYQRMHEDCARWEKIRKAMGLGMCRVVVRWSEFPDDGDVDMSSGVVGLMAGKKDAAKGVTRSETRRRSGLGPGEAAAGGILAESKSRVTGNREPLPGAGGATEKGKKVKER